MMLAFAPDYGLSFLRGMFATVNPCGFVLLPTYLIYFLGMEASGAAARDQRATVRRALLVGTAVAAGFMGVFVVIGLLSGTLHTWFVEQSKYVTLVLGAGFVVLGTAILAGYRPKFATPNLGIRVRSRNVTTMFLYGVGYAVASLGCTMIIFIPVIAAPRESFATSFVNVVMFAAGMGLVVIALTVSLALANQVLLRTLRRVMQYVDLLAGAFMVLSGLYLVWYFVVVDVQDDSDTVTAAMRRWERRVTTQLNDNWQLIAGALVLIVGAAVAYTVLRRPAHDASSVDGAASGPGGDRGRAG